MSYTEYALGFCFSSDKKIVVVICKHRPEWQKGNYNGIGGHIEEGETPVAAMVREFEEETGVTTRQDDWFYFAKLNGAAFAVHCFACFDDAFWTKVETKTDEEVIRVGTMALLGGSYPLVSNVPWLINLCRDEDFGRIFLEASYY